MDLNKTREILARTFPAEAIRQRKGGGGRTFDYIGHDTATRRLIEATDNKFDWTLTRQEFRDDGGKITMLVSGILCIEGLGCREGTGVQAIQTGGGEDQYKGAESDALKRAAMRFGVAIDLYGEDVEGQIKEAEVQVMGTRAAQARVIPPTIEGRLAAVIAVKDVVGPKKLTEYIKSTYPDVPRPSALDFDQLGKVLGWAYSQEEN